MKQFNRAAVAFFLLLYGFGKVDLCSQPTVVTRSGAIEGSQNGTVQQFLGIPYAKAPVDSLRWRAPKSPELWNNVLSTKNFKPACPQLQFSQNDTVGRLMGDEDCLYLNVWTPQTGIGNRPVMVFVHGGGNQQGAASDSSAGTAMFFGKNIASRSDVVVVTINYRLGALGFMVHPGLDAESVTGKSGNYAVLDQILALQWVKNNISLFGGDSLNITVFGESAGGINTGNLLLTSAAAGLFHKVIIQSAVPNLVSYNDANSKGMQLVSSFANATGSDAQKIAYMRSVPADSFSVRNTSPLKGGLLQLGWGPTIDDVLFNQFPNVTFQSGNFNKVPVIIGSNADEMSLNAPVVVNAAMVTALINSKVPLAYRQQVQNLYPVGSTNAEARKAYVDILSDAQFTASVRRAARCISQNQSQPVYQYLFSHAHTIPQFAGYGAYHGIELFYVFNTLENSNLGLGNLFKPQDDSVQQVTRTYWANFARNGNPNGTNLPNWPLFTAGPECYLEIKATPENSQCALRKQKLDLWDEILNQSICQPIVSVKESIEREVFFYPNPANDKLYVQTESRSPFWVSIKSLSGNEVIRLYTEYEVALSHLPQGIYVAEIWQEQKVGRTKIVVCR
jgi:para-nitrobenzyl esterase